MNEDQHNRAYVGSPEDSEGAYVRVTELDGTYEVLHGDGRWLRVESVIEVMSPVHRVLITVAEIGSGGVDPAEEFLARKVA